MTGGAGYIGSAVTNDLIKKGHRVTVLDNLSTGFRKLIPSKASFYKTDISNITNLRKIFNEKNFDIVMHFAAFIKVDESVKKPSKYYRNNYDKTKTFLNFCIDRGISKIIFSSTAAVYGNKNKKVSEKDRLSPKSPYAKSKLNCEKYIINQSKKGKCSYVILRYFNVAGSPQNLETGLITKKATHLIKKLCEFILGKKKSFYIYGSDYPTKDGTAIRDFIHISDLSQLHILSMNYIFKNNVSQIFNCGYGKGHSVLDIVKVAFRNNKQKSEFIMTKRRKGDVGYAVADNSKIIKHLKFKPKLDNINLIFKSALKWEKKINSTKYK